MSYPVGLAPQAVAVGDFNGDGKLDLGVTSNLYVFDGCGYYSYYCYGHYEGRANVLLGNGTGSFAAPSASFLGYGIHSSAAVADFNGDIKQDFAAANNDNGTVSVLLGTGTGSFKPPVNVATAAWPVGVAVGNFNGDGRPDAASANSSSDNVSVLLNDGTWPPLDAPSITINDVTVTEGNIWTTVATFTASLSAACGQTASIHYATADGDATASSDYQAMSGTLAFTPGGPLTQTVTVQVIGDRLPEYWETFSVRLTDPTNAFVADATGVGTIADDEPTISIVDYVSGVEGNTGTTAFTFTVTLSVAYDQAVTMSYRTVDGTATTGDKDYVAKTGTLTFSPGETTKTITIVVNGDVKKEGNETFFLDLFGNSSNSFFIKNRGIGTILNDDPGNGNGH